jgi:hypothetical protein
VAVVQLVLVQQAQVAAVLVLQVMAVTHQVLLEALVDLAVALAVAVLQAAQAAQEYFTFSTREQL